MTSLRLALKQSLEESSGGFSPPSLGSDHNTTIATHQLQHPNAPPSPPGGANHHKQEPPEASYPHPPAAGGPHAANHTPNQWKRRGPGRPRKNSSQQEGGTAKKRGRPRKHPVTEHEHDASSSENEFSGDGMEEGEDGDHSVEDSTVDEHRKSHKKKRSASAGESGEIPHLEPPPERRNSISHSVTESHPARPKVMRSKDGNAPTRVQEQDKDGATKAKTVPPPDQRTLSWARTIPTKEARQKVDQGMRVKVRFSTRVKRDGKFIRKKKWYGGLVAQVSKAGSKIRIKYDDGTSEVAKFPDKDIVVDDSFNGEHQGESAGFFVPPEGIFEGEEEEEEEFEGDQDNHEEDEEPSTNPEISQANGIHIPSEAADTETHVVSDVKVPETETQTPTLDKEHKEELDLRESDFGKPKPDPMDKVDHSETDHSGTVETEAFQQNGEAAKPQKRKRGRPPKIRPHPPNEILGEQQPEKSESITKAINGKAAHHHVSESPALAGPAIDPLVDTPDQPEKPVKLAEVNAGRKSPDGPQLETIVEVPKLTIRLPKTTSSLDADVASSKPTSQKSESSTTGPEETSSRRIHIQLTGASKASTTEKEQKVQADPQPIAKPENGRITPPTSEAASQKPMEDEKAMLSPRSKKQKRKRAVELSPHTRSRSPKPQTDDANLHPAGSALEKNSAPEQPEHPDYDEGGEKIHTPRGRPGKHDSARSARRASVKEPIAAVKPEDHFSKKKKKRDRRRDGDGEDSEKEEPQQQAQAPWVQCDKCKKWRIIPSNVVGSLPDRWFCENNVWDPKRQSCDAPQQKDKQQLREKKRRKKQRLMEKAEKAAAATEGRDVDVTHAEANSDGGSHERETSSISKSIEETTDDGNKKRNRTTTTPPVEAAQHSDTSEDNPQPPVEKNLHKKKLRSHVPEPMEIEVQPEVELPAEMKPRGRGRPRRALGKESDPPTANSDQKDDEAENLEWVQCEKCDKWRKLPPHISADELPDIWYCAMNTWNPASASCNAPEDKADGLTDIFSNGAPGYKLSYRNLIFGNGRRFNRPISERTRAAESLFAAVSDDTDIPPTVTYAGSSAFICRSKLNQTEEVEGLSVLQLMDRSHLWEELRGVDGAKNGMMCAFDKLNEGTKECLKDLILHSLGRSTMNGEEVANEIQHRSWDNVPLGWAAARPHCTASTIVITLCELVKEGVLECVKENVGGENSGAFVLYYRRAESCSKATLKSLPAADDEASSTRCMKFAKPWKSDAD